MSVPSSGVLYVPTTSDGGDFAASGVALTVLAVVEAPVPELLPQPASATAAMASTPTVHFVVTRGIRAARDPGIDQLSLTGDL
jgi:hypothetical protein